MKAAPLPAVAPLDAAADAPAKSIDALPTVTLMGVRLHAVTQREAVDVLFAELGAGRGGAVVTPNLDHLRRASQEPQYRDLIDRAELVVADGMPLVVASRVQGTPLPERVAGSDLIWLVCERAAAEGRSVFLLGGREGTAPAAAETLQRRYQGLRVAGWHCPPVGFEASDKEMDKIVRSLEDARADVVFVALGSPKQERLISELRDRFGGAWWLGVGISFSFVCGDVARAPIWMRRAGLEWLHRLCMEPRRLFRRYVVQGLPFAAVLGAHSLRRRLRRARKVRRSHRGARAA